MHDYMDTQPEINAKMRMILFDWLIEVHRKFELMPETLYLTINIVDRFLSVKAVRKKELQLVGISAMLLASKYEEIWAPQVLLSHFALNCLNNLIKYSHTESDSSHENLNCRLTTLCSYQIMPIRVIKC